MKASAYYSSMESPLGTLHLTASEEGLTSIWWNSQRGAKTNTCTILEQAKAQLREYFAGYRTTFELPLAPKGTTFQLKVWAALQKIPYGDTRSYGEIAKAIKNSNAARAVGLANSKNPLPIVVPCHRVIGSNGALVGFSGGMKAKKILLSLESRPTSEKSAVNF